MSKSKNNNKKIVLDSCVFNKLFLDEEDSQRAIDYLKHINTEGYIILVPSIFLYEVLGVAEYFKYDLKEIYSLISDYEDNNLKPIHPNPFVIQKALEMTKKGHDKSGYPSFYDSVYHALAIENNCDFITADGKHEEKVRDIGYIKTLKDLSF